MKMADVKVNENITCRIETCFKVLKEFSWLLDSYILDFFTEKHIEKLPKSWSRQLLSFPPEELCDLMDFSTHEHRHIWPLSLLCLKVLSKDLNVQRQPGSSDMANSNLPQKILKDQENFHIQNSMEISSRIKENRYNLFVKHPKLKKSFLKHVKPKKQYEISVMAEMTASTAQELDINYVVDIGSGLGHLSRVMAYDLNLNVCGLESQITLVKQAEKLHLEFEATASKYLSAKEMEQIKQKRPTQAHFTVSNEMNVHDFVALLKRVFNTDDNNFKFGIVGLHPCGNLTSTLLKIFLSCPEAKFINLVGCCYHKLSTFQSGTTEQAGFPLSRFAQFKDYSISYEARALACHAIEVYCNRLRLKDYHHLKVHCYRATLEKIIKNNWPEYRKCALSNVKHKPPLTFDEYCQSALKKLNLTVPKNELESSETLSNLSAWRNVVTYYSLRLLLAPLIETLILLDRVLYLKENGIDCRLVAAFDPIISPRNNVLTAKKRY